MEKLSLLRKKMPFVGVSGGFGQFALIVAGVLGIGSAGVWGIIALQTHRTLTQAEAQLQKGFAALASETLDSYRKSLVRHPRGCQTMISAYYSARKADRLEWAAQACLDAGNETPEAYLGLAGAREIQGRDNDAIQILNQNATRFDTVPDLYYAMAQLLKKNKKDNDALYAYSKAIERAPQNNQIALEVLEYTASLQRWDLAKPLADRLKSVEASNPEVKLFIARALLKGGDTVGAQTLVGQAQKMLESQTPEFRAALSKAYADVMTADRGVASDQSTAKPQSAAAKP